MTAKIVQLMPRRFRNVRCAMEGENLPICTIISDKTNWFCYEDEESCADDFPVTSLTHPIYGEFKP